MQHPSPLHPHITTTTKKTLPTFPTTPSKSWSLVKPHPFWKFGWRFNPPTAAERGGGAAHYDPPISMFSLVKFCCQTPRTLPATFIWGERSFFHWKIDFLFCLNSFVQDCRLWIFSEKTVPNCLMVLKCILVHCML